MKDVIELESPDLVVFSGDNVVLPRGSSHEAVFSALATAVTPASNLSVPWCAILGNHDVEGISLSRHEMMEYLTGLPGSCSLVGSPLLHGAGNFDIVVADATKRVPLLHLFFFDSGEAHNIHGGYDWIHVGFYFDNIPLLTNYFLSCSLQRDQVQWFSERSQEVADTSRNAVPLLLFFHIPLPEFRELLWEEHEKKILGDFQEKVWHSGINGGLYAAAVDSGRVKGMFVGHDHLNDFCHVHPISNISLCYCGGSGYGAYGKAGWSRRVRVIEFKMLPGQEEPSIQTWKRLDSHRYPIKNLQTLGVIPPDGVVYLYLTFEAWMALSAVGGALAGAALVQVLACCLARRKGLSPPRKEL